jgi:hypothetical protein
MMAKYIGENSRGEHTARAYRMRSMFSRSAGWKTARPCDHPIENLQRFDLSAG